LFGKKIESHFSPHPSINFKVINPKMHKTRSNNFRFEANKRTVNDALNGRYDSDDVIYAKILKPQGACWFQIYFENEKKQGTEGIALLRGLLRRRGQVPVTSNDIVIVTPRSFESDKAKKHFDIIAVLTKKDATDLMKQGKVPDYFLNDGDSFNQKKTSEGFEFDYAGDDMTDKMIDDI